MPNKIFIAKDFDSREELERIVSLEFPLNTDIKGAEIKGTTKELKRLRLSEKTTFWGIKCIATDSLPLSPPKDRPNRGIINKNFGINK
jgi:hypothetical protein